MRHPGRAILVGVGLTWAGWALAAPPPSVPQAPTNLHFVTDDPGCVHGCGLNAACAQGGCVCAPGSSGNPDVVCEWPTCPSACDVVAGCAGDGSCNDCPPGYAASGSSCVPLYKQHLRQFDLSNGRHLQYYANHALDVGSVDVVRAVLVIHGANRDADAYYENMWEAAAQEDAQFRTLIVAPWFRIGADLPGPDEVFWDDNSDWKQGDLSVAPAISSFQVLDEMLDVLHKRVAFPNLRQVIITGHSAGGQYVQRFGLASTTAAPLDMLPTLYAPANPSSYAYLNDERPLDGTYKKPIGCVGYNHWGYGLVQPNIYVKQTSPEQLRAQYRERRLVYLLGQLDTDPNDSLLDVSCAAMVQGAHRLERGLQFHGYLEYYFSTPVHEVLVIPGVGHSSSGMFKSPGVRQLFFGD